MPMSRYLTSWLPSTLTGRLVFAGGSVSVPVNISPPTITGTAFPGNLLTVTPGVWGGTPSPVKTYQWRQDGVAIPGQTGLTYTVTEQNLIDGDVIDVVETATNVVGSASADSNDLTVSVLPMFASAEPGYFYDTGAFVNPDTWRTNFLLNSVFAHAGGAVPTGYTQAVGTGTSAAAASTVFPGEQAWSQSATAQRPFIQQTFTANGGNWTIAVYVESTTGTVTYSDVLGTSGVVATTYRLNGVIVNSGDPLQTGLIEANYIGTLGGATVARFGLGCNSNITGTVRFVRPQVQRAAQFTTYQPITDFNTEFMAAYPSTSLFADTIGAVATINGPVGLQFDKARGQTYGAELVDTMNTAAAWSPFGANTVTNDAGEVKITYVDTANGASAPLSAAAGLTTNLTVGVWYQITGFIRVAAAGPVNLNASAAATVTIAVSSTTLIPFRFFLLASNVSTNSLNITGMAAGEIAWLSGISVKAVSGLHRYQLTAASRPILRGTPTGANEFVNGDFATGTLSGWTNPDTGPGTTTVVANKAVLNNNTTGVARLRQTITVSVGQYKRVRFTVSGLTGATTATTMNFGSTTTGDSAYASIPVAANGTYERWIGPMTTTTLGVAAIVVTGVGACSVELDDFDCKDVSYNNVAAPYGLQYDGVDDFLLTATADFTTTDAVGVCVGIRKLSDAAAGILIELGTSTSVAPGFTVLGPNSGGTASLGYRSAGTVLSSTTITGYAAPVTAVITGQSDISLDSCVLRVNGVQVATSATDQGTGNYPSAVVYFGRRSGSSSPGNDIERSPFCNGRAWTATELSAIEHLIANRTGVTI
jgi:hypothetical protein